MQVILKQVVINVLEEPSTFDIGEKFKALFPSIYIMCATLLAVIILTLVLWKLFYRPVKKMISERKKFIQDNIDASIKEKEKAIKAKELADQKIIKANQKSEYIVQKARTISTNMTEKARRDSWAIADKIIVDAKWEIKNLKEKFVNESKKEIVNNAILISKKIIGENVSKKIDAKYVDELLKKESND